MEFEGKTKIVCIGDSLTDGYGLADGLSASYPSLLQEFLGDEVIVFNEGVAGSCVTMMETDGETFGTPYVLQPEYDEALSLCGDIYVIMLGTNDALENMHTNFETFYQYIVDGIRQMSPDALLYFATPVPIRRQTADGIQEDYLLQLLPHIRNLAEHNNATLIDLHEELLKLPPDELDELYQEDGIHPNSSGTFLIASTIAYIIGNRTYNNL